MDNIVVKKSKINGKGVFAKRDFKKGEVVLRWNPKTISKKQFDELAKIDSRYLLKQEDDYFLMQSPEKFVNHSCDPNTKAEHGTDVALRDIETGEEITSSYYSNLERDCNCGSKKCKRKW